MDFTSSRWLPIVLLTLSNIFMTFAWYGHLKFKTKPLLLVILVSWGIAFLEYCFQVPANRWGSNSLFALSVEDHPGGHHAGGVRGVRVLLFREDMAGWNHVAAFVCILAAVAFAFWPKN